jgi:hypothetical protein
LRQRFARTIIDRGYHSKYRIGSTLCLRQPSLGTGRCILVLPIITSERCGRPRYPRHDIRDHGTDLAGPYSCKPCPDCRRNLPQTRADTHRSPRSCRSQFAGNRWDLGYSLVGRLRGPCFLARLWTSHSLEVLLRTGRHIFQLQLLPCHCNSYRHAALGISNPDSC